jgi:hypothetical protein
MVVVMVMVIVMVMVMVMVTDRIALNETIGMKWGDTK